VIGSEGAVGSESGGVMVSSAGKAGLVSGDMVVKGQCCPDTLTSCPRHYIMGSTTRVG